MIKDNVWSFLYDCVQNGVSAILMIVVESGGETPGKAGFKMAISADGASIGTIGGGTVEYKFFDIARKMLEGNNHTPFYNRQIHNDGENLDSSGMICGGFQTVLLFPIGKKDFYVLEKIVSVILKGGVGLIEISPSGIAFFSTKGNCKRTFIANLDGGEVENWRYKETLGFEDAIYIVGAGHVGLAISQIISNLDFKIVILDDRKEILESNKYAHQKILAPFTDIHKHIPQGDQSYVVIMTPSHRADGVVLSQLVTGNFAYLGMMGSQAKVKEIFFNLENSRISKDDLKKVKAPIGLPIGSSTPFEIAISVVAEIIAIKNKREPLL